MQIVIDVSQTDALTLLYIHELLTTGNKPGEAIWMNGAHISSHVAGVIDEFCSRVRAGMETNDKYIELMIRKLQGILDQNESKQ